MAAKMDHHTAQLFRGHNLLDIIRSTCLLFSVNTKQASTRFCSLPPPAPICSRCILLTQSGTDYARMGSQTEMGNLDDFLSTAELSNRDFTAERMNVSIVTAVENEAIISEKREVEKVRTQMENQHKLRIPRRPQWEKGMDKDALQQAERESFIEWRRTLAELQELDNVLMTPFERNIEFWRQLWRVIERSVRCTHLTRCFLRSFFFHSISQVLSLSVWSLLF